MSAQNTPILFHKMKNDYILNVLYPKYSISYFRLTSNRRRWTHIFPKGPTGQYQACPNVSTFETYCY